MHKKKPSYLNRRHKDEVNKKGLIWAGAGLGVLIVLMAVLLVFSR
jgi:hypothetical protein